MMPSPRPVVPLITAGVTRAQNVNVTYQPQGNEGPVLANVEVVTVFWGTYWEQQAALITDLNGFFKFIVRSSLVKLLAEYSTLTLPNKVGSGTFIGLGTFKGTSTITATDPGGGTASVTDTQVQAALAGWVQTGSVPPSNPNTLYFIFIPPGLTCVDPNGLESCKGMCGYHFSAGSGSGTLYYAVMPTSFCPPCMREKLSTQAPALVPIAGPDTLTVIASHELCEAITDPYWVNVPKPGGGGEWTGTGWFDTLYSEIGDICAVANGVPNTTTLGRYLVQPIWSQRQGRCAVGTRTGIALTGVPGWQSIPVAFSNGDGSFNVTNKPVTGQQVTQFAAWAAESGVRVLTGDFNGDGRTDIALTGVPGWASIPVAFSNGDGSFAVTNASVTDQPVPSFAAWAAESGVRVLTGDFNGDGRTDIALLGVPGQPSIPVALSTGYGSFQVTNDATGDPQVAAFVNWAAQPGVGVLTGDFNGDGLTDIALLGVPGQPSIPVALANGDGSFHVVNTTGDQGVADFAGWAAESGVQALTGDFNGDGLTGIALTGGPGWQSIPVALANGDGSFHVVNTTGDQDVADFATWAAESGVQVLTGDFQGYGYTGIALAGGPGWQSIPVASSTGDGSFRVTNVSIIDQAVTQFAIWAAESGVQIRTGDFNGDGRTDIALMGLPAWQSIPVAFSNGDGSFNVTNVPVTNQPVSDFATWAAQRGVTLATGDFA